MDEVERVTDPQVAIERAGAGVDGGRDMGRLKARDVQNGAGVAEIDLSLNSVGPPPKYSWTMWVPPM